jgi:FSR family fosmidomycin resistance protein-like MFS transporter
VAGLFFCVKAQTLEQLEPLTATELPKPAPAYALGILFALSFSHLINDSLQALIPASYPLLKQSYGLTFSQIGMITLVFQMSGSIFQPLVGFYTDRNPKPYSLVIGMCLTLCGLAALALATRYGLILLSAGLIGLGSAIFHPESSRTARLASGGRHGFAQSLFQVGGNFGSALGPLLAAWIIIPHGQRSILVFSLAALAGMVVLSRVGNWYAGHLSEMRRSSPGAPREKSPYDRKTIVVAIGALLVLIFSKFFYLVSFTNYFTFYLMNKFGLSAQHSQFYLFLFLFAVAAGTIVGGPVGDRIGRRAVIWISILGISPFALVLPHANLFWTSVLAMIVGFGMASAFPAILVFATELLPGNVGLIAGLFFGLAFGMAGIGAASLGNLADRTSIQFVFGVCAFLPLLGLFTGFLPRITKEGR